MKRIFPSLSELEVTAWILVSAALALALMLGHMLWEQIGPTWPTSRRQQKDSV